MVVNTNSDLTGEGSMKIQRFIGLLIAIALVSIQARTQALDSAEDFLKQGVARVEQGDWDGAIADYTLAIEINSKVAPGSLCRGGEIVISDLFNALALNNRGFAHYCKGNLDKALADFDLAIRMAPRLADAYNNRGNIWQGKGDLEKAQADFNQAIKLNPRHSHAFNNRANLHQAKGELNEAIADYSQSITLEPAKAIVFANRGLTFLQLGQRREAETDFNRAIELNPALKAQLERLIQSEPTFTKLPEKVLSTNTNKEKP
jgi:tetratricopeptide (TPR) repeat protein